MPILPYKCYSCFVTGLKNFIGAVAQCAACGAPVQPAKAAIQAAVVSVEAAAKSVEEAVVAIDAVSDKVIDNLAAAAEAEIEKLEAEAKAKAVELENDALSLLHKAEDKVKAVIEVVSTKIEGEL